MLCPPVTPIDNTRSRDDDYDENQGYGHLDNETDNTDDKEENEGADDIILTRRSIPKRSHRKKTTPLRKRSGMIQWNDVDIEHVNELPYDIDGCKGY